MQMRALTTLASLAWACALTLVRADEPALPFLFLDPDDPAFADVRRQGERVVDQAGSALVLELRRLSATAPAAQILGSVHLKNYRLPAAAAGRPRVTAVRHFSSQLRDPANAPDAADQAALDRIRQQIESGDDVSPLLLQRVTVPGTPPEWRVYRPLVLLPECVVCHGTPDKLGPGVADALKPLYPADKATGYRAGQWRGLLRVSLAWGS